MVALVLPKMGAAPAFYKLFKYVNKEVAAALVVFVAIGAGLTLVNLIFHFAALLVATDPSYASALGAGGSDSLALFLLDIHRYGYVTARILFGLWMLPLGYLAYTSGMFPRVLGVVLMIACFGYLIDTLTVFLVPDLGASFSEIVKAISGVAEFWMVGYLLFIGVRTPRTASTQGSPTTSEANRGTWDSACRSAPRCAGAAPVRG